jgi:hypothetical protein
LKLPAADAPWALQKLGLLLPTLLLLGYHEAADQPPSHRASHGTLLHPAPAMSAC